MTVTINGSTGITTPGVNSTGSNVLGDNVADTLNVGNGAIVTDSSGNVGIGTSSPSAKLDVVGVAGITTTFGGNTARLVAAAAGTYFGSTTNTPVVFQVNANEVARIESSGNLLFNSGYGSAATAYGCRAWVNFDGTGTVAIRASGNVSSITDNGTGDYTVNFTTAMPDANYCASGMSQRSATGAANQCGIIFIPANGSTVVQTSSAFRVITTDQSMIVRDSLVVTVCVVR